MKKFLFIVGMALCYLLSFSQETGTFTDTRDGKVYKTIKIGNQIWMAENLSATKFNDGTEIPLISDSTMWSNLKSTGFCWYQNDYNNAGKTYGAIYNWYAINDTLNGKNICPDGWHVPTKQDYLDLVLYVKMTLLAGIVGNALDNNLDVAKAIASTQNWKTSNKDGSVGNSDFPNKRNVTGFNALPSGMRRITGQYSGMGEKGVWWGSTKEEQPGKASLILISSDNSTVGFYQGNFNMGCSIRCVKNITNNEKPSGFQNGKFILK
jgi:uncharacterized protein (TIGR02145 family)